MPRYRNRRIAFDAIGALLVFSLASLASADPGRGQQLFGQLCSGCHSPRAGDPVAAGAGNPDGIRSALQNVPAMQIVRGLLGPVDIADIADYLAVRFNLPPLPPPPTVAQLTVVEFHHAALDAGATIRGWLRTGATFGAWSTSAGVTGASPVCRFYIPPGFGDSHFYSASPAECDEVRLRFPQLTYESPEVMAVSLPDLASGACPPSTNPIYRLWNTRVDSNHRYVATLGTRETMIAKGYVPEGYGPAGVAFCAPL